jgi:trehalose-6-phosphatase
MGDDVTDETAFAVLQPGDVGIHVGLGPSLAGVTVPDPSSLADLLDTLVALRTAP